MPRRRFEEDEVKDMDDFRKEMDQLSSFHPSQGAAEEDVYDSENPPLDTTSEEGRPSKTIFGNK